MKYVEAGQIVVATRNKGKMREIRDIYSDLSVALVSLGEIWPDAPDIAETGTTFLENAGIKAKWVSSRLGTWALADDSGLEVEALGGEPGVLSARYGGEHGGDANNVRKLLDKLIHVPPKERTARFRCVVVLRGPDGVERSVEGVCEGVIGFSPCGTDGFGYDPVFIPEGHSETFAELPLDEKNMISHRGRALRALRRHLDELFG